MKLIIYPLYFLFYGLYRLTGWQTNLSYKIFRYAYVLSNGSLFHITERFERSAIGRYPFTTTDGILGNLTADEACAIAKSIDDKGYHVLPIMLPAEQVDGLVALAESEPAHVLKLNPTDNIPDQIVFDETNPVSNRYSLFANSLVTNKTARTLLLDKNLLQIAQEYLGAKPILDIGMMWWSLPVHGLPNAEQFKSKAAQMFHFDLDRLKFLKVFVYLTDVDMLNGPHVYVEDTHRSLPKGITAGGRYSDSMIESLLPGRVKYLTGKKGTILFVDTRGIHKGLELEKGKRLIFQMEYCLGLFGKPELEKVAPENKGMLPYPSDYRHTYEPVFN